MLQCYVYVNGYQLRLSKTEWQLSGFSSFLVLKICTNIYGINVHSALLPTNQAILLGNINKIHLIFQEQVLLVYFFLKKKKKKYYNLCFQTFFDDIYFLNFSHFAQRSFCFSFRRRRRGEKMVAPHNKQKMFKK